MEKLEITAIAIALSFVILSFSFVDTIKKPEKHFVKDYSLQDTLIKEANDSVFNTNVVRGVKRLKMELKKRHGK